MTISVVIPSYNGSAFIEQAILSVLAQHRPPDEILICDDNSSDNTLGICRKYKDRIAIYPNPNGPSGFVNAWNRAIACATGEYISILHQYDLLAPDFIEKAMAALEKDPHIRHLFSTCCYIDHQGAQIGLSYTAPEQKIFTGREYLNAYQNIGDPHIHRCPGVITHHSIFEQCRYEPRAGHIADDDFFYRVGMYTDVIGILTPLASFRIHNKSETGGLEDAALAARLMDDYIYQCRQWKDNPFLDKEAYGYFTAHAYKYIRRCIGYSLFHMNISALSGSLHRWMSLHRLLTSTGP